MDQSQMAFPILSSSLYLFNLQLKMLNHKYYGRHHDSHLLIYLHFNRLIMPYFFQVLILAWEFVKAKLEYEELLCNPYDLIIFLAMEISSLEMHFKQVGFVSSQLVQEVALLVQPADDYIFTNFHFLSSSLFLLASLLLDKLIHG